MSAPPADQILNSATAVPVEPHDLLAEGARVRKLSAEVDGVKALLEGTRLVNDAILVQVLFALWDSGFYEFSLTHPRFRVREAADELRVDPTILNWLMEYLVGRGILQANDGEMALTDHGIRLSNVLLRGTMNVYIGGWGRQLTNIGPLLRKEMPQTEYRNLRSQRHTVMGTEQLSSVRTAPAILKVLAQHKRCGVLHLACRTGQFLIELARREPTLRGLGVDRDAPRIAAAQANASAYGVDSRLRFLAAEVGNDPLPLDRATIDSVDAVAALYLLHEVRRYGVERVVGLLRQVKTMFPGRLFLSMETLPYCHQPQAKKPPTTFTQLDYLLIHRLRDQGLPLPAAEWKAVFEEAGLKLLEVQEIFSTALYVAEL